MQDTGEPRDGGSVGGPEPARVHSPADLVRELDRLRVRAARGSGRSRVTLEAIAQGADIPRSTVHSYVRGLRLPPPDSLDRIVVLLGADRREQQGWAQALERLADPVVLDDTHVASALRAGTSDGSSVDWYVPALRTSRPAPRQLPAAPRGFVGRGADLDRLSALTRPGEDGVDRAATVVISGTGGVGKSALVLNWAHRHLDRFPGGQVWIDLRGFGTAPPVEAEDALEQMLRAVGTNTSELPPDVESRAAMFRSAVSDRTMLLVLDNARDAGQVVHLLPGAPGVTTVITSRSSLRPLVSDGASRLTLARMSVADAVALLRDGDAHVERSFEVLRHLAESCDGLPLALRIARELVAEAPDAQVAELADGLDRDPDTRLDVLDLNDPSLDVSMRGVLDGSYRALPTAAARLLRLLPLCHVPTVDVACANALTGSGVTTTRRALDHLVSSNMLDSGGRDTFRVHDLVAAFARERLRKDETDEQVDAAQTRLVGHLAHGADVVADRYAPSYPWAHPWPTDLPAPPADSEIMLEDAHAAHAWIVTRADMIGAVIESAVASGRLDHAATLAERAGRAIFVRGDLGMFDSAFSRVCAAAEEQDRPLPIAAVARFLGMMWARRGDLGRAIDRFAAGAAASHRLGLTALAAIDDANVGVVLALGGDMGRGIAIGDAAIALIRDGGLNPLPAMLNLVGLELARNDLDAAHRRLIEIRAEMDVRAHVSESQRTEALWLQGRLHVQLGELAPAWRALDAALRRALDGDDLETTGGILATLSTLCVRDYELGRAEEYADRATELGVSMACRSLELSGLIALADVAAARRNEQAALAVLDDALGLARSLGLRHPETETLVAMAECLVASGRRREALEVAERAAMLAGESSYVLLAERARRILDSPAEASSPA